MTSRVTSSRLLPQLMTVSFVCLFVLLVGRVESTTGRLHDVCKWQSFEADCAADSVIRIDRALFGRMRLGSCLTERFGQLGCVADVRWLMERRCAGRHRCRVQLPDHQLDRSPHGCSPELAAYLEVEYHCQTVTVMADGNCSSGQPVPVQRSHGYLASVVTEQTQLGSDACPWLISTQRGQTVSVTLHDFGVWRHNSTTAALQPSSASSAGVSGPADDVCIIYAELRAGVVAGSEQRQVLVCGRQTRHKLVYSSHSADQLQVAIHAAPSATEPIYFMLEFQVGCADYNLPEDAVQLGAGRHDDSGDVTLRIACLADNSSWWVVRCRQGTWTSDVQAPVDCAHARARPVHELTAVRVTDTSSTNQGVLIIVVIGTALLLSVVIVALGIIYLRRRSRCEVSAAVDDIYGMTRTGAGKYCGPLAAVNSLSASYSSVLGPCGALTPAYHDVMSVYDHNSHIGLLNNNNASGLGSTERDYATTLQMRQTVAPLAVAAACPSQLWTCPVHGRVVRLVHPPQRAWRLYEVATRLDPVHEDLMAGRGSGDDADPVAAAGDDDDDDDGDDATVSPFYHELEPSVIDSSTAPGACCANSQSAHASHAQQQ